MTIRELCRKINGYNEVARMIGGDTVRLGFRDQYSFIEALGIEEDYKAFVLFLKKEFIDEAVDAILHHDGYVIGEEAILSFKDKFNDEHTLYVVIYVDWN